MPGATYYSRKAINMTETDKQLVEDRKMIKKWTDELEAYECRARKAGFIIVGIAVFILLAVNFPH